MKRALLLAALSALCLAPIGFTAASAAGRTPAFKAQRNAFGQPDLGGSWTNATITSEVRPAGLGARLVYTPEEVARLEGDFRTEVAVGNERTDPNAPAPKTGGEAAPQGYRATFANAVSVVGGYNRGWIDPGSSVMRVHGEPRTSFLTTPDGRAPARKAAAAAPGRGAVPAAGRGPAQAGQFDNPEQRALGERCLISFGRNAGPPMLPNGFYNNNYRINQSRDAVAIWVEMVHDVRIVRLNAKHRTDGIRPWFGDSIGHFEGETLVVETTNIPQSQAYNGAWQTLTVTERFTRVAKDRLLYQYTIADPALWDAPWGGEYEFASLNGEVYEYGCHEGNYALEGVLAGARAEEAARGQSASLPAAGR